MKLVLRCSAEKCRNHAKFFTKFSKGYCLAHGLEFGRSYGFDNFKLSSKIELEKIDATTRRTIFQ